MIKVYCQYSYGGFKTFYVEGQDNELMDKEVLNEQVYDFPSDAYCYFQYGGAKMVYRSLNDGRLDLVVREIPSLNTDGDGRKIPCAVQFVGDKDDKALLDNVALGIACDLNGFEEFFSHLFRIRQGLRIDGKRLYEFLEEKGKKDFSTEVPQLMHIPAILEGVMLFVPLSENFGKDRLVTERVCQELKLDEKELKLHQCVLQLKALLEVQPTVVVDIEAGKAIESKVMDDVKDKLQQVEKEKGMYKKLVVLVSLLAAASIVTSVILYFMKR